MNNQLTYDFSFFVNEIEETPFAYILDLDFFILHLSNFVAAEAIL